MTFIFDKIQLSNSTGSKTLDLPIVDVDPQASYILKDVMGLGPPDIDVAIMQTLYQGGIHQLSRVLGREIVMRLRMNPDYGSSQTVADLRSTLYGFLSVGKAPLPAMMIRLFNGSTEQVRTWAYIKKFEIVPFAKEPEVQITFSCLSQYLEAPLEINVNLETLSKSQPNINNPGSAPCGFHMELTFTDMSASFVISSTEDPSASLGINFGFVSGDKLTIDTRVGYREVGLVRDAAYTNLINWLDVSSTWLQLIGGENIFTCDPDTFDWYAFNFTPQYWGV